MRISNWLNLALLVSFVVIGLACGVPLYTLGRGFAAGGITLVIAFGFFSFNWISGGDAKLMATMALWMGLDGLFDYWVLFSFLGGPLTIAILLFRNLVDKNVLPPWKWLARLHDKNNGVPYGIALAIAGVIWYPNTLIFEALLNRLGS